MMVLRSLLLCSLCALLRSEEALGAKDLAAREASAKEEHAKYLSTSDISHETKAILWFLIVAANTTIANCVYSDDLIQAQELLDKLAKDHGDWKSTQKKDAEDIDAILPMARRRITEVTAELRHRLSTHDGGGVTSTGGSSSGAYVHEGDGDPSRGRNAASQGPKLGPGGGGRGAKVDDK